MADPRPRPVRPAAAVGVVDEVIRQIRTRYLWITWGQGGTTIWLCIAGRKPLAHLPRWKRNLLHLRAVRWRLWPKPWNLNGPTGRPFRYIEAAHRDWTNQ